jgi:hypothetical protein
MKQAILFLWQLNWAQKLLLFAILAVSISWIFKLVTPTQVETQPTVLKNVANLNTNLQGITFTGTAPSIPEQLPTGSLLSYEEVANVVKDRLISKFQLTPKDGSTKIYQNDDFTLSILSNPDQFTLSQKTTPSSQPLSQFSQPLLEELVRNSDAIVAELYPENPPQIVKEQVRYIGSAQEPAITDSVAEAELVMIPYLYQFNGYPVYLEQNTQYVAYFMFNAKKELVKAEFRPYLITFSPEKNFQSVPLPLAMSNINNNRAALIYTDSYGQGTNMSLNITAGVLDSARLEYRVDPTTSSLVPYYHFYGTLNETADQDITAQLITPAIQTNFGDVAK